MKIVFCTAALALVAIGAAQTQAVIKPFREMKIGPASPIDTTKFVPAIEKSFTLQPMKPKNELLYTWEPPSGTNNLLAGGLLPTTNVSTPTVKWPAIGATGWTPPDPDLGVGPNHVVAVVNSSLAFFSKSGTQSFQQTFGQFFAGTGATSFIFDPKAVYDPLSRRYMVIACEFDEASTTSKMLFAISDDSDPNGTWYRYRIETKLSVGGSDFWLDYPGFGVNRTHVAFCGNMFGFTSGWAGNQFVLLPKAPLLTGAAVTAQAIHDPNSASVKLAAFSDTDDLYAISVQGGDRLKVQAVNPTGVRNTSVVVPQMRPPQTPVPGPSGHNLDALDGRLYNAVYRAGTLVTAHGVFLPTGNQQVSRWYDINLNGWPASGNNPTLIQSGNVAGAAGQHYHMPAVAKNKRNEIAMILSRSSTSIQADLLITGRKATDPLGTLGTPVNLLGTPNLYGGVGTNRWGDYFGMQVDPVDDATFWAIGMTGNANGGWQTHVYNFRITNYEDLYKRVDAVAISTLGGQGTLASGVPSDVNVYDFKTANVNSTFVRSVGHVASLRADFQTEYNANTIGALRLSLNTSSNKYATMFLYLWNYQTSKWDLVMSRPGTTSSIHVERIEAQAAPYVHSSGRVLGLLRTVYPISATGSAPYLLKTDRLSIAAAPRL